MTLKGATNMSEQATKIRDAMWAEVQGRVHGLREEVWAWLEKHGPATSEEVAEGTGICLLTVRPRLTELCQWQFAACVGRKGRSGVYAARTAEEARTHWEREAEPQLRLF